jgi:hypothetical protein
VTFVAALTGLPNGGYVANDKPSEHVSAEFQTWRVRRGEVMRSTNETTALSPGVESRVMPPLATSWAQFREMTAAAGRDGSAAIA